MDSWVLLKEEGERFFKIKDYQKACDHYKDALTEIESQFDESEHDLKVEASKITSNISLMYLKLSNKQNDEYLLHDSKIYAKKTISYNPKWTKGYLRLAAACSISKDVDDILNAITVYVQDNKDAVLNDDFISLLKEVKYYTHKTIMMSSPSWHLVKYKDNVHVVDSFGAGHFKDLQEFINCHGTSVQRISVLVRPGVYVGIYELTNATIDIVGDCNIEINPTTKAIDKDPTIIFTNTLEPTVIEITSSTSKSTFLFDHSEVSLKRISVHGEMDDRVFPAIASQNTVINLLECCFVSKRSYSLCCFESSKLYCKRCRSVVGYGGVMIESKSHAKLTDCLISEMDKIGIEARVEAEMISLKHCTITKCKWQGLLVHNGAKVAKVLDSYFEGNCILANSMSSIHLSSCRVLVKNTFIRNQDSTGISIVGGSGNFDNVVIENCKFGIVVRANVEIKNCIINGCTDSGILIDKLLKGFVVLENNTITNCRTEIVKSDDASMPTIKGENKHAITTYPSINAEDEKMFKETRKSRRIRSLDKNISSEVDIFCGYCGTSKSVAQHLCKTLKVCEECKMVLYCSPECQRKDWKLHEPQCEMFVKTKLAAREKMKAIHTAQECTSENKESDCNETEENNGSINSSDEREATEQYYCSIL